MTRLDPHRLRRSGLHAFGVAFALLLAMVAAPFAHPSGTSRAIIRLLDNDSLTLEIDANTLDVMEAISMPAVTVPFDAEHTRLFQQRAAHYLLSRVTLAAGGEKGGRRSALEPRVISWKRDGRGPDDDLASDSVAARDTVFIFTYGGTLPEGATTLVFSAALFPEFGVQALCEASVYWKDTLIERRWLTLDKTLRVPLARDSLDALLAATRAEPARASGDGLFARFTGLGFTHILPHGLDHILFVLALFFFSTRLRPLLLQVTAFTIAHSCTLALTLLDIVSLPPHIVEPLIALSIAVVGLENVFFRNVKTSRWLVVFAFGLIHGMGFAGVLGELGLPEGGFWPALIGFNLGVELGQLAVIAIAFALTVWFRNRSWYFKGIVVPVSLAISAVGLYWAVARVGGG
jgi:hydrogenase/urease accessory protein HupE